MTGKKLFKVYKGKELRIKGFGDQFKKGIVCGFHKEQDILLMAVTEGHGWKFKGINLEEVSIDVNIAMVNSKKGFQWISEYDIIRQN